MQTKDHGYWSGSETSAHGKLRVDQYRAVSTTRLVRSLPVVVGKAHGHHIGNALHSVAYIYVATHKKYSFSKAWIVSFYALSVQFLCWSLVM